MVVEVVKVVLVVLVVMVPLVVMVVLVPTDGPPSHGYPTYNYNYTPYLL